LITKSLDIKKLEDYLTGKQEEGLTDYIINNLTQSLLVLSEPLTYICDKITEKELELAYYAISKLSNRLMREVNTKRWNNNPETRNHKITDSTINSLDFTYDIHDKSEQKYYNSLTRGGRILRRITCPASIGLILGAMNYKEEDWTMTIFTLAAMGLYLLNEKLINPPLNDEKKEVQANKTRFMITLLSNEYFKNNIIKNPENTFFEYNTIKKRESLIKEIYTQGRGKVESEYVKRILLP